jgi:hypothetical protein
LACAYFAVTVLVIVSATPEGGSGDTLMMGLALLATLPARLGVLAFQDVGGWTLVALAVCALVNAFVFWVVLRGDPA